MASAAVQVPSATTATGQIQAPVPTVALKTSAAAESSEPTQSVTPATPVIPVTPSVFRQQAAAAVAPVDAAPSAPIATAIATVLTSLTDALSGGGPAVPTDTAVAAMLAATRRGRVESTAVPAALAAKAAATATATTTLVQAESMLLTPSGGGKVMTDRNSSGGAALVLTSATKASTTVTLPASTALVIRAKATLSSGSPNMTLSVDGVPVTTVVVNGTSWANYTFTGVIPAGSHVISISSSNSTTRRSLYLDTVTATSGSFIEEFQGNSGAAPSSGNWSIKTGSGWDPGVETYQTSNVMLDGQGHLVIKATKSRSKYYSGWVETKNKVSFGYGTITARIKVPKGQGLWPAFWLKGANEDILAWPQSGEIDVLELPSTSTTVYSTLHGPIAGTTATQQAQIISTVPDLSTDYHNYWVRHLPDEITFGIDGQTLGTLTPAQLSVGSQWVYNQPMFAIMNLAVGGSWAGPPNSSTPFPSQMLVDWIRWDPPA